jgi:hypothetical protein
MGVDLRLTDESEAPVDRDDATRAAIWATARAVARKARQEQRSETCSRPARPREGWRG